MGWSLGPRLWIDADEIRDEGDADPGDPAQVVEIQRVDGIALVVPEGIGQGEPLAVEERGDAGRGEWEVVADVAVALASDPERRYPSGHGPQLLLEAPVVEERPHVVDANSEVAGRQFDLVAADVGRATPSRRAVPAGLLGIDDRHDCESLLLRLRLEQRRVLGRAFEGAAA